MSTIKSSDEHLTLNADGTSKDIKFQANGVEKASIDSSGNLTVSGNLTSLGIDDNADATAITIDSDEIVSFSSHVKLVDNGYVVLGAGEDLKMNSDGTNGVINAAQGYLALQTGSTERMRIDGSGLVSISQTGNASAMQVSTSVAAETTAIFQGGGTGGVDVVDIRDSGGNSKFKVRQNGGIGINYTAPSGGQIYVNKKELVLNVTPSGTAIVMSPDVSSAFEAIDFRNSSGSQIGSIACSTTATAYNTSSDYRLKENVDYTWDATTRLKQLKPARFNFIADDTNTLVDGFIAHEVSSVVPEAITGEKDAMTAEVLYSEGDDIPEGKSVGDVKTAAAIDPQGIDQSKLVPLLVKTIQELEARIAALEA